MLGASSGEQWRAAEAIFRVVRGYPNEINAKECDAFLTAVSNRDNHAQGSDSDFRDWMFHDLDREMYGCVEMSLGGKCADTFNIL